MPGDRDRVGPIRTAEPADPQARTVDSRQQRAGSGPEGPMSYAPHLIEKGTLIGDHYRVIEAIGMGGMGQVLRARDEMLDREVAIKVLKPATPITERVRRRFMTEARATARVRHENVVAVYAVGEIGDAPYMVMEFVEGCDLEAWLIARPEPPIDEAFEVLRQVCRGVQAIHDAGTIHRDLKPSNVMLGAGFRAAVGDLGLARFVGNEPSAGSAASMIGTPTYMAPEAIMGSTVPDFAVRADIYSLGVMGFELMTGKPPFKGSNVAHVMTLHLTQPPPIPSEVRPALGQAFDAPILAALAKSASDRPASAREWYDQLLRAKQQAQPPRRTSVLVADDDEDFRAFATAVLEASVDGIQVATAADGKAAIAALERNEYSLLFLDLEMPEANGLEVMAAVRSRPVAKRPTVVVVSAVGSASDWSLMAKLGADSFLVKPVTPQQLSRTVRRLLGEALGRPSSA